MVSSGIVESKSKSIISKSLQLFYMFFETVLIQFIYLITLFNLLVFYILFSFLRQPNNLEQGIDVSLNV